ncbi:hypothetical protein EI94DRAFT_1770791 [Lactarius quietus]|nr:hypothetical protein EI94DRAFT_1770791 [Lactarius quietus]
MQEVTDFTKGVPPRLHEPKTKGKPCITRDNRILKPKPKPKKSHKREASEDEASEEDEKKSSASDNSETKAKKKRSGKMEHDIEPSEEEDEEVDDCPSVQEQDEDHDDGLNNHQQGPELKERPVKKDLTLDLLTVMSDKVVVRFKTGPDKFDIEKGWWCNVCKSDKHFVKKKGKHRAFHKGGNSLCCAHAHQHYTIYKAKCKAVEIPINHWAVPCEIWRPWKM